LKAHTKPGWALTREQRDELRSLMAEVDPDAGEEDGRFLGLLGYWRSLEVPWNVSGKPRCYLCRTAPGAPERWVTEGVQETLNVLSRFLQQN
jgi:hypothetical protein